MRCNYSACCPVMPALAGMTGQIGGFYLSGDRNSFNLETSVGRQKAVRSIGVLSES